MSLLTPARRQASPSRRRTVAALSSVGLIAAAVALASSQPVSAGIVPTVPLATAADYSVLGSSTVTNIGPSVIGQSVGLSPGPSIVGFPPGIVLPPATIQAANAVTAQAQLDLTTAYVNAAGRLVDGPYTGSDLVGLTLAPGVYSAASKAPLGLSGQLVLDGQNDPNAVFIFQTDSTLITSSGSTIALIRGASECNVFWQVGSSATLGSGSLFVGNILAQASVTVETSTVVHGRALALTGAVTLDHNVFTSPSCSPSTDTVPNVTAPGTTTTTKAPDVTVAPEVTDAPEVTAPAETTPPAATNVVNTVPVNRNQTTTTGFTVTDITLPRTGSSTTSTSVAASAFLMVGAIALLVARRRRPI